MLPSGLKARSLYSSPHPGEWRRTTGRRVVAAAHGDLERSACRRSGDVTASRELSPLLIGRPTRRSVWDPTARPSRRWSAESIDQISHRD